MGLSAERGHLEAGAVAEFVHLTDALAVAGTWIGGEQVFAG